MSDIDDGSDADKTVPKKAGMDPRRRRMIVITVLLLVVAAVVLVSQWDIVVDRVTARWSGGTEPPRSQAIATYSGAQGAQDAPRSEVPVSRRSDREKCMDTLRLRRVALETARDSCEKMVSGIYH